MQKEMAINGQVLHALMQRGYHTGTGSSGALELNQERAPGEKRQPGESRYRRCPKPVPWTMVDFLSARSPDPRDLAEHLIRFAEGHDPGLAPSMEKQVLELVERRLGERPIDGQALEQLVRGIVRDELQQVGAVSAPSEQDLLATAEELDPGVQAGEEEDLAAAFDEKGEAIDSPKQEPERDQKPKPSGKK
jgi:hypothetical protein